MLTYLLVEVGFHLRSPREISLKSLKASQLPSMSPRKSSWHSLTHSLSIQCRWWTADKHHAIPENIQCMPVPEETAILTHSLCCRINGKKQQWHLLRNSQQLSSQGVKKVHADKVFPRTSLSPSSLNIKSREGLPLKLETRARVNLWIQRLETNPTTSSPRDPCIPPNSSHCTSAAAQRVPSPLLPCALIFKGQGRLQRSPLQPVSDLKNTAVERNSHKKVTKTTKCVLGMEEVKIKLPDNFWKESKFAGLKECPEGLSCAILRFFF